MSVLFGVGYCPFTDEKRTNAFLEDDILLSRVQLAAVISRVHTDLGVNNLQHGVSCTLLSSLDSRRCQSLRCTFEAAH